MQVCQFRSGREVLEDKSSATFCRRDGHVIKAAWVSQTIKLELVYFEIMYGYVNAWGQNYVKIFW